MYSSVKTKDVVLQVYCIVNNAGVMGEREGWKLCMEINLTGVMHGATLAIEKMGNIL